MSSSPVEQAGGPAPLIGALRELGLSPPVTAANIKKAYRERSRQLHPDRNPSRDEAGATDAMAKLNAAYRLLSDYIGQFRYQFSVGEYYEQHPRERVKMQFSDSDNWGKTPRRKARRRDE